MIYQASEYFAPIKVLRLGPVAVLARRAKVAAFGRQPSKALGAVHDDEDKMAAKNHEKIN